MTKYQTFFGNKYNYVKIIVSLTQKYIIAKTRLYFHLHIEKAYWEVRIATEIHMASLSVITGTIFTLLLILKLYNLDTFMKSNFVVYISTENVYAILRISAFPYFYIYVYRNVYK